MRVKLSEIRQLISETLRGDSEDNSLGDPTQISYGRPYEECLDAMMNLIRLVFEVGMSQDTLDAMHDQAAVRAVNESSDNWVLHVPVDMFRNYLQNERRRVDPQYGRRRLLNYVVSSPMKLYNYILFGNGSNTFKCSPEDLDVLTIPDPMSRNVIVNRIPSEKFIKQSAEYVLQIPSEYGWY